MHASDALPSDIWITVLQYLSVGNLANLAKTSRYFHALVQEYGWNTYLRSNPRHTWSILKSMQPWSAHAQVRYHTVTDHNWTLPNFVARPLASRWTGKLQPHLTINKSRLLVAAAGHIHSYTYGHSEAGVAPSIQFECTYMTNKVVQATRDITSIQTVLDGGFDRTVYLGYADGMLERVVLPVCKAGMQSPIPLEASHRDKKPYLGSDAIESISSNGEHVLALSSSGSAVFLNINSSNSTPQFIELGVRSWAAHLTDRHAVLGASSLTPLMVHSLHESRLSTAPSHFLTTSMHDNHPRASAVYGICGAPPSAPWGASEDIVISGWYDGLVNVHDLRSSRRAHRIPGVSSYPAGGALYPVLSLCDPWLYEPIYAVSAGGGSGCHIAAGTARHSVVAFWDVRAANRGWSVHAPGNDSSPVYSVVLESSRLFGATQSRPFALDFGPGVKENTYPPLTKPYREEGLKKRDISGAGFYVTRYGHSRTP